MLTQSPAALAASDWTIQVTRDRETMPPPLALELLRKGMAIIMAISPLVSLANFEVFLFVRLT